MQPAEADSVASMYVAHRSWLHAWLHRKLGCWHKADDLAQDTFLKVLKTQACAVLREPRAFLTTVAHGLVVSHWRRSDLEVAYLDALAVHGSDTGASPEDRLLALESLARLDQALSQLPPKARQAFLMARLDGLGYKEIAEELLVSERMVKKYMAQAMHLLLLNDV